MLAIAFWEDYSKRPVVKYAPGDEIADDHPKRDWLLASGIAVDEPEAPNPEPVAKPSSDEVPASDDAGDQTDGEADNGDADPNPEPEAKPAPDGKPKPTDSVEAHRAYLKSRKIDPKGMSRPQMIKAIAGLDD